jgi:hypothetical protein
MKKKKTVLCGNFVTLYTAVFKSTSITMVWSENFQES